RLGVGVDAALAQRVAALATKKKKKQDDDGLGGAKKHKVCFGSDAFVPGEPPEPPPRPSSPSSAPQRSSTTTGDRCGRICCRARSSCSSNASSSRVAAIPSFLRRTNFPNVEHSCCWTYRNRFRAAITERTGGDRPRQAFCLSLLAL
ncbi:MAG: hypothetical protein AAF368_18370, partial [Planctomycetota bacterium]